MSSNLSDYLASRYLVADTKTSSKKRKRKGNSLTPGLVITDDDAAWGEPNAKQSGDGEDGPVTVSGTTAEFRKSKSNNWKSVGGGCGPDAGDETETADAVLASVAAEKELRESGIDDAPVMGNEGTVKMSDGTHAGLQSAASVAAQLKRRDRDEREEFERHRKSAVEEETVYRDATGRRIDLSMKKAEARRAAADAEEKERLAKEALKGDVQMKEAQTRREQLDNAKLMSFSRSAEDEEMNEELKLRERWNDPMLQFMAEKKSEVKGSKGLKKNKPTYGGAAPPNRYGIRPGYRWDGVDRGIGFEAERYKAINRRERLKGLDYSWQMDE